MPVSTDYDLKLEYTTLLKTYDFTYEMSDDPQAYKKGAAALNRMISIQKLLPESWCRGAWNAAVNKTSFDPDFRRYHSWLPESEV